MIIPTHERREDLRRALRALSVQSVDPGAYEVVVSLDACTDGTATMVDDFDSPFALRRVAPSRRGRAAACNAAIAAAHGEVVIILDDDMEPVERFVENHVAHHPTGSRRCAIGAVPVELDADSTHAARYVKRRFDLHLERLEDPAHLARPRSFYSGNASLRAEVMRELGGFDESFGIYGNEDVELSLRLRGAGVELVFDPEALARQHYGKGFGGLQRDTIEKGRTTVMLARVHPDVFPDLRLADPYDASRPWLAVRALLLAAGRRVGRTPTAVFALATALERAGLWRSPLFYRAALDYAFWAGADAALQESGDGGDLAMLAKDLKRGPIDLLLHR